jgi:hypothetical protein
VYLHAGKERLAEVLRRSEHRVGVERHLPERIGDRRLSRGPLRLENAQTPLVVVAPEERDVGSEELGQHARRPVSTS